MYVLFTETNLKSSNQSGFMTRAYVSTNFYQSLMKFTNPDNGLEVKGIF